MGTPMAANLARAGFAVRSFDRNGSGSVPIENVSPSALIEQLKSVDS